MFAPCAFSICCTEWRSRDVADLVAEHTGELAHSLRALDEPAIHVDEPAGHRERVHFRLSTT